MKVSFSVFSLLLLFVKICRSRDVLSKQIPGEWKRIPKQKPFNNHKDININNKKLEYPLSRTVPTCHALPVKINVVKPAINLHVPVVSPKLLTHMNPDNNILQKCSKKSLNQPEIVKLQDIRKEDENKADDSHVGKVLEIDKIENTLQNTIPKKIVKANSEQYDNNNELNQTRNDLKDFRSHNINSETEMAKQARKWEIPRPDVNKTILRNPVNNSKISNIIYKHDQMNTSINNKKSLKSLKILTNNCFKNNSGEDVNNTRSYEHDTNKKSDIKIVITHDTNFDTDDPDVNIIIHNEDYHEIISGTNNKVQGFRYQNGQDPICNVREVLPYDYGRFTKNQYTLSLSDEGNYGNMYHMERDTKQDNKYPYYNFKHNKAAILRNVINSNVGKAVNDNSNANYISKSLKNIYVIIINNQKNIKLFFNYGSRGNKKFNQRSFINSHSDYRNRNNFKPNYPRYVNN